MYYEINVSKLKKRAGQIDRYEHYFATAPRSITFYKEAVRMLKEFMKHYSAPAYNVTISEVPEQFEMYTPEEFLKKYDKENNVEPL
jgi:hypothetical protein